MTRGGDLACPSPRFGLNFEVEVENEDEEEEENDCGFAAPGSLW